MRIYRILPTLIVFLIGLFAVPSVFSANIGRNVYSVWTETYNGATHYKEGEIDPTNPDAVSLDIWSGTLAIENRTDSPVPEGSKYMRFTVKSTSWVGAGISCANTSGYKNMSSYYNGYLKFYARASVSNPEMVNYKFGIKIGSTNVWLNLNSYGFSADGNWHEISVPLNTTTNANLTSANLANITQLFMIGNEGASLTMDHAIDIDNIAWVKSGTGSFTPSLKRVSDDVTTTGTITWNSASAIGNNAGWLAADQYIELDLDMYLTNNTWKVIIYTDNGAIDRNGLMSPSLNHRIPLCWRASDYKLPYEVGGDTRTLTIGEVAVSSVTAKLYDAGRVHDPNDANYWCWFWITDETEIHSESDYNYNIIWNNSGFHSAENAGEFYLINQIVGIYPKIYLGAKFLNVVGGQRYSATITVEFAYE